MTSGTSSRRCAAWGLSKIILSMIPGFNKIKDVDIDERELVKVEAVINSMTKKERKDHNLINGSRRRRIAHGKRHDRCGRQQGRQAVCRNKENAQDVQGQKRLQTAEIHAVLKSPLPFFTEEGKRDSLS